MKLTTNLKEVKDDLLALAKRLTEDKIARTLALTGRALVLDRVQQRGLNSKEVPFLPYSKRPFAMPYAAFVNSYVANKRAITAVKRLLTRRRAIPYALSDDEVELFKIKDGTLYIIFGGGYEQFRRLVGRQTKRVDMTLTGQMLNDYNILPVGKSWGAGFRNPLNVKKYRYNVKRRGEFLILSDKEIKKLREVYIFELNRIINEAR